MILQALNDYYHRKSANDPDALAPEGFERKEIPFVIVIDRNGNFVDLQDTREKDKKGKLRAKTFLVPQSVKRSGKNAWQTAFLLWDTEAYVLGHAIGDDSETASKKHESFKTKLKDTFGNTDNEAIRAIIRFLGRADFSEVLAHPIWTDVEKAKGGNFTFRLDEDIEIVAERPAVKELIAGQTGQDDGTEKDICLVTGSRESIERLHPSIKGVWGAQTSGANIVSFNLDSFISYGKKQGDNAPVGEPAAFAYTTALNTLLGKDSRQRIQVGDASTVFWAEKTHPLEDSMADFLNEPQKDDPDRQALAVKALYDAPWSGNKPAADRETRFYILGLAPNASRISVRFWHVATVAEVSGHILQHFEDTKICHADFQKPCLSLFRLLSSIAVQEKSDNTPPNLAGDTMKAILGGTPYPATLLQAAIRRNRAAQDVSYPRASLIKACLNRTDRFYNKDERELTMALDPENTNIGYNLGRLFAVLEKIQEEANPGLNATIRDRYYGAASATPVSVFPVLMKLSKHHLSKLESDKKGLAIVREGTISAIVDHIDAAGAFPNILKLEDQGRFAIGYYHQRQKFFEKKSANTEEKEAA